MKKVWIMLTGLILSVSLCKAQFSGAQTIINQTIINKNILDNGQNYYRNMSDSQLDSNEQYKSLRDGFVLQGGQLKLARNGNLYTQDRPVTLKNGAIIMTDGLIKMTNGSTPLLKENDFIDMDGNIRPLQKQANFY
jgi:hypothetical protein